MCDFLYGDTKRRLILLVVDELVCRNGSRRDRSQRAEAVDARRDVAIRGEEPDLYRKECSDRGRQTPADRAAVVARCSFPPGHAAMVARANMRLGSGAGVLGSRKGLCGSTVGKGLEKLPPNGACDGAESDGGIGVTLG